MTISKGELHGTIVTAFSQNYLVIAELHSRDMTVLISTNIWKNI